MFEDYYSLSELDSYERVTVEAVMCYQRSQHWTGLRPDVGDYPQIGKL